MFHKTRHLNHQPVKFKIKSTLLNIDAKVIQKNKKQYDVILCITKIQYKVFLKSYLSNKLFKSPSSELSRR